MRLWFTRLAAAIVVVAGPALLIYATADDRPSGLWTWLLGGNGVPWPTNFQAAAAFGYALAIGVVNAQYGLLRTLAAAIGCFVLPILGFPLFLFFNYGTTPWWWPASVMAVLALPTALFQIWVLRDRHSARFLQVLAHLIAATGLLLAASWLGSDNRQLYQMMPALLVLIPFVALAMRGATPQPSWRFALACMLGLLPIYAAKTAFEARAETVERAASWPVRVHREYKRPAEHRELVKKVTTIRPGVPVRIGEHWYRFERFRSQNPRPNAGRRPDRITWLQIRIPAEDLDLHGISYDDHVQLNIIVDADDEITRKMIAAIEKSPQYVSLREGDLHIRVVVRRDSPVDHNTVREKIRRFIQKARVDPPPG
jgi:hypothetical protein